VKYSTHDVTGLDGRYSIGSVPPGEVTVTAFLPGIGAQASTKIKLMPNTSRRVDLTLKFDVSRLNKPAAAPADAGVPAANPAPTAPAASSAPTAPAAK
jgi:hypothetical protein